MPPIGGFWHNKGAEGDMWIDGLFMGELFNQRYGKTFKDAAALDEAGNQIMIYAAHGEKQINGQNSGLFYHGWDEDKDASWANKTNGQSSEVWAEGLGWYALSIVETMAVLPPDHPRYKPVLEILRRLVAALKKYQDPATGRWFDIVDKGDRADNWTDSSGTGMFTYTVRRAVELRLVEPSYAEVAEKGYQGLINPEFVKYVNGLVQVTNGCDGVNIQNKYENYVNYRRVTNAKETVGGFLWGTAIMEKPTKAVVTP